MSTSDLERFAEGVRKPDWTFLHEPYPFLYSPFVRRIVLALVAEVREARNLPRSETHSFYLKYEKARAETDAALKEQIR